MAGAAGRAAGPAGGPGAAGPPAGGRAGGVFCFGMGYVALALAGRLGAPGGGGGAGWRVAGGTVRSPARAARLQRLGFDAVPFSGARACAGGVPPFTAEAVLRGMGGCRAVLASVPPGAAGDDPVLEAFRGELLAQAQGGGLDWVGYLSTTSVYGDWEGGWVDEKTEPRPESPSARARLEAEARWLGLAEHGVPVHVFRLAGVYGPRRSLLEAAARGPGGEVSPSKAARLARPYTSRVHVADVASALRASLAAPRPRGGLYCVVDDDPTSRREALAFAETLVARGGVPAASEAETAGGSAAPGPARAGAAGGKRVLNTLLKQDLGLCLAYPSYREGLAALASEPSALDPFDREVLDVLIPP